MPSIRLEKVSFGFTEPLFKDINLSINDYDRIGVIANNGAGKTTLLKCIAGLLEPQEGRIIFPKGLKFGLVEQGISERFHGMNFYEMLNDAIPADIKSNSLWRIEATLDDFKVPADLREKSILALSGGWQRLALIARMVLSNPDVLILDEPTNHLDLTKIFVLEKWLNEQVYDIPLITVSHDRNFLANCTNKTIFLRGTQIREYAHSYFRAKHLLNEDENASIAQRTKEIKEIERLKRSAHELRQMGVNNYSDAALKKSVQMAKRAENRETQLTNVHIEPIQAVKLSNSGIQAKKLIELNHITIHTPDGIPLFHIDHLVIKSGERLIIFGKNGCGKTQFLNYLKTAINDRVKREGTNITPTLKMGYIDQHLSFLPLEKTLRDYLDQALTLDQHKLTGMLINAGFPHSIQRTKLHSLSYGQRTRVAFLMLHLLKPNFYILDEPTNHLDISGQEQLEAEILEQGAATIVVSHDRTFTENIGTTFYAIDNKHLTQINKADEFYQKEIMCLHD